VVRDRSNGAFLGGYIIKDQAGLRTLTPAECERLMGFPDNYTLIPGARDGSRYRVLGNSMAVPVMRWLGRRIAEVHNYELQGNRQMGRSEEGILLHVAGAEGL
jgi:DNA (cytosine-5)-methyltransferase 1